MNPSKRKVILIRHAESAYNAIAASVNKHIEGKDEAERQQEIAKVKFQEDVIDCSISEKGEEQVKYLSFQSTLQLLLDQKSC